MDKILNALWLKLTLEPAMALEVVKQMLNLVVLFNFVQWDAQQMAGVNIFVGILLQFVVRQTVTPNPRVETIKTETEIKIESQEKQAK